MVEQDVAEYNLKSYFFDSLEENFLSDQEFSEIFRQLLTNLIAIHN
jgi:hypothetical protein